MPMRLSDAAPTAHWLAGMLGEKQPGALVLLRRGVSVVGDVLARDLLHDVQAIEATGGISTRQATQRLTPCGVYLRLLSQLLDAHEERYVFGTPSSLHPTAPAQTRGQVRARGRARGRCRGRVGLPPCTAGGSMRRAHQWRQAPCNLPDGACPSCSTGIRRVPYCKITRPSFGLSRRQFWLPRCGDVAETPGPRTSHWRSIGGMPRRDLWCPRSRGRLLATHQ